MIKILQNQTKRTSHYGQWSFLPKSRREAARRQEFRWVSLSCCCFLTSGIQTLCPGVLPVWSPIPGCHCLLDHNPLAHHAMGLRLSASASQVESVALGSNSVVAGGHWCIIVPPPIASRGHDLGLRCPSACRKAQTSLSGQGRCQRERKSR